MPVDQAVLTIGVRPEGAGHTDDAGAQPRRDLCDQAGILGQAIRTLGAGEQLGRRARGLNLDGDRGRGRAISGSVRASLQRR